MARDPNERPAKNGKGRTYGNEQENRLKKRRAYMSSTPTSVFDFAGVQPATVWHCVQVMASIGGALRFGATRDGGALSVGFYLDGDTWTEYVRPQEDAQMYFETQLEDLLREAEARGVKFD